MSREDHSPFPALVAATSHEVVQADVHLLIQQLEAGHSDALTAYSMAMQRSHCSVEQAVVPPLSDELPH